jgi:hypothetical protein
MEMPEDEQARTKGIPSIFWKLALPAFIAVGVEALGLALIYARHIDFSEHQRPTSWWITSGTGEMVSSWLFIPFFIWGMLSLPLLIWMSYLACKPVNHSLKVTLLVVLTWIATFVAVIVLGNHLLWMAGYQ